LRNERFVLIGDLMNVWIDIDLRHKQKGERKETCMHYRLELEKLVKINELLWEIGERSDMYKWFLEDAIWWPDYN
jgi:hypothetical protein